MELISREAAIDEMAELQGRASTRAEMKSISKAWKRIRELPTASKHDEFEKELVDLFAPIMECDINHPKYEETVADIIKDVMKVYDELHPAERKDNG